MRCQKLRSLLPAYCKNELESSVSSSMELHFHDCESCREELALHRLIATSVSALADSAPNENHDKNHDEIHDLSPTFFENSKLSELMNITNTSSSSASRRPEFSKLHVSSDFNNNLMERIASERHAETRAKANSKAFLPKRAPKFAFGKLIPVLVSVSAVAALTIVSLQQGIFEIPNSANNQITAQENAAQESVNFAISKPANSAFVPDPIISAPALGEQLGLSEEYMTAQPINNPVYSSASNLTESSSIARSSASNQSLVASQTNHQRSNSRRWHFARDYARARRILHISKTLSRRGAYFKIVQLDANGAIIGPVGTFVFQGGSTSGQRVVGVPQIIVQPIPNAPVREQAPRSRMVRGSF